MRPLPILAALAGCAPVSSPEADALRALFPDHATSILDDVTPVRSAMRLADPAQPLTLEIAGADPIRVHEAALGQLTSSGSPARTWDSADGSRFWRQVEGGAEEWLLVDAAHDGEVARWRVEGAGLRQLGDHVQLLDRYGRARVQVSAPWAIAEGGLPVSVQLSVDGSDVVASLDLPDGLDGVPVLVDPIWLTVGDPLARAFHTSTLLPDGRLLLVGGFSDLTAARTTLASADIFDPATFTTVAVAQPMSTPRALHQATLIEAGPLAGQVLISGGVANPALDRLATAELFDPATGTFTPVGGALSAARARHEAIWLPSSGKVLIAGGSVAGGAVVPTTSTPWIEEGTPTASADLFDPATGNLTPLVMQRPRVGFALAPLPAGAALAGGGSAPAGSVLVVGGTTAAGRVDEIFNPATETFLPITATAQPRVLTTVSPLPDGRLVVFGPATKTSLGAPSSSGYTDLFNPATGAFTQVGGTYPMAIEFYNNRTVTYTAGPLAGRPVAIEPFKMIAFNPATLAWSSTGNVGPYVPVGTDGIGYTVTLLPDGRVVRAGGGSAFEVQPAPYSVYDATISDRDGDGVADDDDNCPDNGNRFQEDQDQDGLGNACDNCRAVANADQSDLDADLRGDACDNCELPNASQADQDLDGAGDLCDSCVAVADPTNADSDGDGLGDACDVCPAIEAVRPPGWTRTTPMATARAGHALTALTSGPLAGKVLATGGYALDVASGNLTAAWLASTELYDPAARAWTPGPALPEPRTGHVSVQRDDGQLLILGSGYTNGRIGGTATNGPNARVFDPVSGASSELVTPFLSLGLITASPLLDGRVLVYARVALTSTTRLSSAWIYDPGADSWTEVPAIPSAFTSRPLFLTAMQTMADGRVMLATNNQVRVWDPVTQAVVPGAWDQYSNFAVTRLPTHPALGDLSGDVLAAYGYRFGTSTLRTFEPGLTWASPGYVPVWNRVDSAVRALGDGRAVLAGGYLIEGGAPGAATVPWTELFDAAGDSDNDGAPDSLDPSVCVPDPLQVVVTANKTTLWPPNGAMHDVTLTWTVSDQLFPAPTCVFSGVDVSQVDPGAYEITGPDTVRLRARRDGGHARVYTLEVTCVAPSGEVGVGAAEVVVPHHR